MAEAGLFWAWLKQPCGVVSITVRPNKFKMVDGCQQEVGAQKNQNWGYYETKCPAGIWATEEIQQHIVGNG